MVRCINCRNKILLNNVWLCNYYNREIDFKEVIICARYKEI